MKFSKLTSTSYNAGTKTLKFAGQTGSGLPAAVEMPLDDENVFLAVMAAHLYDGKPPPSGNGKSIIADQLSASFQMNEAGEHSIVFTVRSGSVHLRYVLPIQTTDAGKIAGVKGHIQAAFALLSEPDRRVTH